MFNVGVSAESETELMELTLYGRGGWRNPQGNRISHGRRYCNSHLSAILILQLRPAPYHNELCRAL
jgi:hypothetical protein